MTSFLVPLTTLINNTISLQKLTGKLVFLGDVKASVLRIALASIILPGCFYVPLLCVELNIFHDLKTGKNIAAKLFLINKYNNFYK